MPQTPQVHKGQICAERLKHQTAKSHAFGNSNTDGVLLEPGGLHIDHARCAVPRLAARVALPAVQ